MKFKNIAKRVIPLFCLTFTVSLTAASCGTGTFTANSSAVPEIDAPEVSAIADTTANDFSGTSGKNSETSDDVSDNMKSSGEETGSKESPMEITWGYDNGAERENVVLPDDSEVIKQLNAQFNVTLKGIKIPVENNMFYGNWEAVAPLPDVLTVSGDADYAYGSDRFRAIPHEMIERCAPNLAALLNANPDGWAANTPADGTNEFLGLGSYYENVPQLNKYSAYRLDWLEQAGVTLPADMVEVSPGQYFSPTPFTVEKFYEAMRAFSRANAATPEHYGFVFPMTNDIRHLLDTSLPNLGVMFGLTSDNMNDGGKANMYYATENYRAFLEFLADMYAQGFAAVKGTYDVEYSLSSITGGNYDDGGLNKTYEAGYWSESTGRLVDEEAFYSEGRQLIKANPGAKILYTPPETYIPYEKAEASASEYGGFDEGRTNLLMVSKGVSDEKLALILGIYDACAFDTETRVLGSYGIEGVSFDWAGEPYNSYVKRREDSPTYNNSQNLLNPSVRGGPAFNAFYESNINPNNPIYLHSLTPEAAVMFVPGYAYDAAGEFNEEISAWQTAHYADVRKIVADYFYETVLGEADVSATWNGYIESVNAAGLPELLGIMEKMEKF